MTIALCATIRIMVIQMLLWWYTTGWIRAAQRIQLWTKHLGQVFSVSLLLRTLFAPWRRIGGIGGGSIDDKIRAAFDTFISRCVGFAVRVSVLIAALLLSIVGSIAALLLAIIWPAVPLICVYLFVRSITG